MRVRQKLEYPPPERRIEVRRPLGISPEFEDQLDQLFKKDTFMWRIIDLFWKDMSGYAIENGHRLDRAYKTIERLNRIVMVAVLIISALLTAIGIITVLALSDNAHNTKRIAQQAKTLAASNQKAVQTSRFDSAFRACSQTDIRNATAAAIIQSNDAKNPAQLDRDLTLLDSEIPQRGTPGSNPSVLTSSQTVACDHYANLQTSLHLPPALQPLTTPVTSTTTTSTSR